MRPPARAARQPPAARGPVFAGTLIALAAAKAALHLATARGYGIFRDELYYLACARHLDWGYVDHPPLSIGLLWLETSLLGDSLPAIRLLPALAGGASVFVAGLLAREMGGGRGAQALAAIAALASPLLLTVSHFYSMNVLDWLFWSLLALILCRIRLRGNEREWLAFGAVAGLALLNKLQVAVLGAGIVLGLLLTPARRHLAGPWIHAGGALALGIFLPHLVWQASQGWPTLEFVANARAHKIHAAGPLEFLGGLALLAGPIAVPLLALGAGALLGGRSFARLRPLGWAAVSVVVVFLAQQAKVYYAGPIFPPLFAAGAVALEGWRTRRGRRWRMAAAAAAVAAGGVVMAPFAVPLLSPERFLRYQAALGLEEPRTETHQRAELPQHFADMFGWRELAATVARVHQSLPDDERRGAAVLAQNYGEAGAVDHFGPELGLPPAVSGHNSYWLWGPDAYDGGALIAIGHEREELERWFREVRRADTFRCRWCMPYERDLPIRVCRDLRLPLAEAWPRLRHFR